MVGKDHHEQEHYSVVQQCKHQPEYNRYSEALHPVIDARNDEKSDGGENSGERKADSEQSSKRPDCDWVVSPMHEHRNAYADDENHRERKHNAKKQPTEELASFYWLSEQQLYELA